MDFFLKSDTIYHGEEGAKMVKLASISSGVLCREHLEGQNTNQNWWQVRQITHSYQVIFLLKDLSLGEI